MATLRPSTLNSAPTKDPCFRLDPWIMKKICRKESWESSSREETGGESLTDLAGQLVQVWYSAVQYLATLGQFQLTLPCQARSLASSPHSSLADTDRGGGQCSDHPGFLYEYWCKVDWRILEGTLAQSSDLPRRTRCQSARAALSSVSTGVTQPSQRNKGGDRDIFESLMIYCAEPSSRVWRPQYPP